MISEKQKIGKKLKPLMNYILVRGEEYHVSEGGIILPTGGKSGGEFRREFYIEEFGNNMAPEVLESLSVGDQIVLNFNPVTHGAVDIEYGKEKDIFWLFTQPHDIKGKYTSINNSNEGEVKING
jgi:co-chaperonin GroES (HSP10)